jgi:hypothetical protein
LGVLFSDEKEAKEALKNFAEINGLSDLSEEGKITQFP